MRPEPNYSDVSLQALGARDRVKWALRHLPGEPVLSSSFGAQAAVMLHLVVSIRPDIPVVFIDTGYHFAETYRFVDELSHRLELNLHVYRPRLSPAWQEIRYGKRWQHGLDGMKSYNRDNKVEPMNRALADLDAGTWFSGIRRQQSHHRAALPFVEQRKNAFKVHPILDWTDRQVHRYLKHHDLPYHPLWHQGYVSIGDHQLTRPLNEVTSLDETRFLGMTRECGLHE